MLPLAQAPAITGYDPVSMQVVCMDTAQHEDCPPSEEEYLEDMIRIWRRKHSSKAPKGNDLLANNRRRLALVMLLKGVSSKPQWRPKHTPHIGRDELIVVLKPSTTLDLKAICSRPSGSPSLRPDDCSESRGTPRPQLPFRGHESQGRKRCKGVITISNHERRPSKTLSAWNNANLPCTKTWAAETASREICKKTSRLSRCDRWGTGGYLPETNPGRCTMRLSRWLPLPNGPVEHKYTPRCLIYGVGQTCSGQEQPRESGTVARTQIFSAEDFPTLPNAQNESQTTAGTSEPMQQSEPSERNESASVASACRCSDCTFVQRVPQVEQRLTKLERTIEELPKKILEGVRASFAELW
ncbi:hypothetical protein HPB48_016063 [Haemaphysalis longicornis]|uniref:Uncharacterized protein n=1 Tax=Haemaphysalis longicornis TaxID=44386 RepID=A0A9J6GFU9_HAELO|nr:hypothetical protein HPB48_016063 [Haemaphysalis longicornis]